MWELVAPIKMAKKGKKAPKVDVAEFDSTLYIDLNTGKLPLPLDVAARIATRFRTSLDLVYKKVLQDPHMFEEFFQIEDLNEKIQKFEVKEDADTSEQKIEDECHSPTKVTASLLVSNYTLESSRINQKYGVTENGEDKHVDDKNHRAH